jgi:hypothetical protein
MESRTTPFPPVLPLIPPSYCLGTVDGVSELVGSMCLLVSPGPAKVEPEREGGNPTREDRWERPKSPRR